MLAAGSDPGTLVDVVPHDARRHASRLAAIARERHDPAATLDRAAQRQITVRRLASREEWVSGR